MKAMVLAAGVGSRLDPLTTQLPKPLVPVANRPVLEHILLLLKLHGFNEVISNLHYLPDQIRDYFGNGSRLDMNLSFHYEAELSGDAGGVRACKSYLGSDTFIVLMGDLLTDANISAIVAEHKQKKALATIAVKEVDDVSQFGVVVRNSDGFITGFQEKPKKEEALSNYASCGIYVLEPEIFQHIPETGSCGFGKELFPRLVRENLPVLAAEIDSYYWSDIGTIGQYRQSNFDAVSGLIDLDLSYSKKEWGYAADSATVSSGARIEGQLMLGHRSKIDPGVVIKGKVIIGDDCVVEKDAHLEDTIVWSNTVIEPNAQLRGCIVGSNCVVSNGSRHSEIATVTWPPQLVAR